jgi:hypothetical protein
VNQLLIPESSIFVKKDTSGKEQFEIQDLQLSIDDYKFVSQFNVVNIYFNNIDIILGSNWMETLGTFILNIKKKFLTISYEEKKITLQDFIVESCTKVSLIRIYRPYTKCYNPM